MRPEQSARRLRVWYNQGPGETTTDPAIIAARNKQLIRETIAGYAVVNEVIEQERIERLRQMTPKQSRDEYAALWQWYQVLKREDDMEGLRRLENWRLQGKFALRRAFEMVARGQGHI